VRQGLIEDRLDRVFGGEAVFLSGFANRPAKVPKLVGKQISPEIFRKINNVPAE